MLDTIYRFKLKPFERKIRQGDIFRNLPQMNYEFLWRSIPGKKKPLENQSLDIIKDILKNGKYTQVESIISPIKGILVSQDCDIRKDYDLIFYPLEKSNTPIEAENIHEFVEKKIRNTTRTCYLPKISPPNEGIDGPFKVIFQSPFSLPYDLIEEKYSSCWLARIIEPARSVVIGKLIHFFSRTPLDEYIFLEHTEISRLIEYHWTDFNKGRKNKERLQENIDRIENIIRLFKYINRTEDLNNIFFLDKKLIEDIRAHLKDILFGKIESNLIQLCDEFFECSPNEAKTKFQTIIDKVFLDDDCLLTQCNVSSWKDKFEETIKRLKEGEYLENVVPATIKEDDKKELNYLAERAKTSLKKLKKLITLMDSYRRFVSILEFDL